MGIQGLLPLLSSITSDVHVSKYAGQRVAVDAYVWLHKGAYCCSMEIAQGIPTDKYINYCMHRVHLLVHHNVIPVLVFDGANLPAKQSVEASRYKAREEYKAKAMQFLREGKRTAANDCFSKAVDISPQVAHRLIERLQQQGIECLVAPYEADAQLAYLAHSGYVAAVISEDSDLLPYGCPTVLFKMDKFGHGKEVRLESLGNCVRPVCFTNFTLAMLRQTCILSGCDYLPSVDGVGVRKAHSLIKRFRDAQRAIKHMRMTGLSVPIGYEEAFERAELTFLHQRVWSPTEDRLVHLTPLDGLEISSAMLEFLGPEIPDDLARKIALADVDPTTLQPYKEERPAVSSRYTDLSPAGGHKAIRRSASMPATSPAALPAQKNKISNYFVQATAASRKPFQQPRKASESQVEGDTTVETDTDSEDESLYLLNEDSVDADEAEAVSPYFSAPKKSLITASTGSIPLPSVSEHSSLSPTVSAGAQSVGKRTFSVAVHAEMVNVRSRFFVSTKTSVFHERGVDGEPALKRLRQEQEENQSNTSATSTPRVLFDTKTVVKELCADDAKCEVGTKGSDEKAIGGDDHKTGPNAVSQTFLAPALQRFLHRRRNSSGSVFQR